MTVSQPLILFYTDFGTEGPYLGQMEAAIMDEALQSRVIHLLSDAPRGDPRRAAYLLAAMADDLPPGCVVVAVVDPGVGTDRDGLIVESGGRAFVGPDNGLLSRLAVLDAAATAWRIDWQPPRLSATFHGRDIFAPVAGILSIGQAVPRSRLAIADMVGADWPEQLAEVIYIDHFGNAMTGLRAGQADPGLQLTISGQRLHFAATYGDVGEGESFWYANSCGLVEIAVNQGSAAEQLNLAIGSLVELGAD
jgi:S-adenosylmethionine hydrolase